MKSRISAVAALLWLSLTLNLTPVQAQTEAQMKATVTGSDFTGLWWNPSENGWGANIIQQGRILFVTMFIYGTNNGAVWLVGSGIAETSTTGTFTGPLYLTNGPAYNAATFNPGAVTVSQVGTLTFSASSVSSATLTYTVNGVTVRKSVVPQTFQVNDLSGTYLGGLYGATASCSLPLPQAAASLVTFTVSHSGTTATFDITNSSGVQCILRGTVTQYGKQSTVAGTYSCTGGAGSGEFAIGQIEAGIWGMTGVYLATSNSSCGASAATIGAARVR